MNYPYYHEFILTKHNKETFKKLNRSRVVDHMNIICIILE